ncbi:putative ferredoxin subunit of nitrite reductase and ring-hydroxylating dioxygenase [Mycobacterium xenopi 3993]|nr:putative ferredoxin subunit of nitrite reductase and ring-hydroxylating dioxygenase [Mycobacterium xenopi 3993]
MYNVHGTFYAIANYCPTKGVRCARDGCGVAPSSTRTRRRRGDGPRPGIHLLPVAPMGFELATGTTAVKPEWSIRTYPVRVVGNDVLVMA